ncbi:MAG: hypothetical protein WBM14_16965 [Terracidiphilus sp.]|jgi:ElaB/YqjD/DUF883 family membrane-anchored ribosome-binding protein
MPNVNNETLLLAFVALAGVAMLGQAIILLALYLGLRKTAKSVREQLEELRVSIVPALAETKDFLTRVGPKIDAVATDMAELAQGLRAQSADLRSTSTEILERARRQASRVDAMLTHVLDSADRAGGFVAEVINLPMRQLSAITASVKAALGVLCARSPQPRQIHSPADKDMFV